jgi:hypothetical protein
VWQVMRVERRVGSGIAGRILTLGGAVFRTNYETNLDSENVAYAGMHLRLTWLFP